MAYWINENNARIWINDMKMLTMNLRGVYLFGSHYFVHLWFLNILARSVI